VSFTEAELDYLRSQPLARISTVAPDGQPDATPVGFNFDGTYFYVGGFDLAATRKYRNIAAGNEKVALVIDDLVATDPWTPRFIRIYGTAVIVEHPAAGQALSIQIKPTISWSWNLEGHPLGTAPLGPRRTVHG
jgi:pyridoxamine 5'-phosphate oxidase family protein